MFGDFALAPDNSWRREGSNLRLVESKSAVQDILVLDCNVCQSGPFPNGFYGLKADIG
jgi:hypothetical protein